jgi:hypothetical protein
VPFPPLPSPAPTHPNFLTTNIMKLHCGDSPVKGFGEISCNIWRRPYFHEYLLKGSITSIMSLSFLNCRCKICPHPTIACDLSILSLLIRFILCFIWGMGKDRGLSITSIVLQISKNCYRAPLQKEGKGCCTSKCYLSILLWISNFVSIWSFCHPRRLVHCASTSSGHWRILWAL